MSGAAIAAARIKQLLNTEEEEMTNYTDEELANEWEFKIVRSVTGAFRNPVKLQDAINQEKRYGWELLEKFDNNRIRFKRKKGGNNSSIDSFNNPYNTHYGISTAAFTTIVMILTFLGVGLLIVIPLILLD